MTEKRFSSGIHPLELAKGRDGLVYIPPDLDLRDGGVPLIVAFHGAGGSGWQMAEALQKLAENGGMILLAPDSRAATWDILRGGLGPDVSFVAKALDLLTSEFHLNSSRFGVCGFSDGASYALTYGLEHGHKFSHILAFSPGFTAHRKVLNSPKIYITHGTRDRVLPIERCSRRIVPQLKSEDLEIEYREFAGGHILDPESVEAAFEWFLESPRAQKLKPADVRPFEKGLEET